MTHNLMLAGLGSAALLLACNSDDDAGADSAQPTTSAGPPAESTSSSSTTGTSTTETASDVPVDGPLECDLCMDTCPEGEKCMPWANDGGDILNATKCAPLIESPDAVGEGCSTEGSGFSGIDSCEAGARCSLVNPQTSRGVCLGFCADSEAAPPAAWTTRPESPTTEL